MQTSDGDVFIYKSKYRFHFFSKWLFPLFEMVIIHGLVTFCDNNDHAFTQMWQTRCIERSHVMLLLLKCAIKYTHRKTRVRDCGMLVTQFVGQMNCRSNCQVKILNHCWLLSY